jgi:hypothetical protein
MQDPALNTISNWYLMNGMEEPKTPEDLKRPTEDRKPSARGRVSREVAGCLNECTFSPSFPHQCVVIDELYCEEEIDELVNEMDGLKFKTAYGVMGMLGVRVNEQGQFAFMPPQGSLSVLALFKSVHVSQSPNYLCLSTTPQKQDAVYSQSLAKMVYKTFHPEVAMTDINVTHKDNNAMNCSLENLQVTLQKFPNATERSLVRVHNFSDLIGERWEPVTLWEGDVIENYFVSTFGRFSKHYESTSFGPCRKLLTSEKRVRINGKLMAVDALVVRAFIVTVPLFGLDQYVIRQKAKVEGDNRACNFRVVLGSFKLQAWLIGERMETQIFEFMG